MKEKPRILFNTYPSKCDTLSSLCSRLQGPLLEMNAGNKLREIRGGSGLSGTRSPRINAVRRDAPYSLLTSYLEGRKAVCW